MCVHLNKVFACRRLLSLTALSHAMKLAWEDLACWHRCVDPAQPDQLSDSMSILAYETSVCATELFYWPLGCDFGRLVLQCTYSEEHWALAAQYRVAIFSWCARAPYVAYAFRRLDWRNPAWTDAMLSAHWPYDGSLIDEIQAVRKRSWLAEDI